MLTEFQITNFKAFAGPETIPIRPITLIFGPNSSGKSSIFQCLLMLKQTIESADAKTNLLIKGDLVDLGSYREFIHRHKTERSFSFRAMIKAGSAHPDIDATDSMLKYDDYDNKFEDYIDELLSDYKLLGLSITFTYNNSKKNTNISSCELELEAPPIPDIIPDFDLDDFSDFSDDEEQLMKKDGVKDKKPHIINFDHFLPPHTNDDLWFSYKDDETDEDSLLTHCAALGIERALKSILHIGPMREYPERYFSFSGNQTDYVGKSGKFVPDILISDPELLSRVNKWFDRDHLHVGYELKVFPLTDSAAQIHDLFALRLVDEAGVNVGLTDVGFGISQVLPVIIQTLISKGKTILIEQPEYHLHPRLQAELGDMFIEAALGERRNKFLIETHSEHLILRIMRRMRDTFNGTLPEGLPPVRPQDVAVLYVEKDGPQSIVREMPLNERGELVKAWPGGFFEEGFDEVLA